ncbi:MAG: DUF2917 domain-containing protein [Betaproteobacteria bacterium]|nr:DUF2917 domain-containing protein [Betaproteobacteria bacterium]
MKVQRQLDQHFRIRQDHAVALDEPGELAVDVLRGHVWITQAGDASDVVLGPGERTRLSGDGLAVIQSLEGTATLHVKDVRTPASRWGNAWQHSFDWVRRHWSAMAGSQERHAARTDRLLHL